MMRLVGRLALAVATLTLAATAGPAEHPPGADEPDVLVTAAVRTPWSADVTAMTVTPRLPLVLETVQDSPACFRATSRGYLADITAATLRVSARVEEGRTPVTAVVTLVGANGEAPAQAGPADGVLYHIGPNAPRQAPLHRRVGFGGVYPGIDVRYYGTNGLLEQDFEVAPHADPSAIALRLDGGRFVLDGDGGLRLVMPDADLLRLEAPAAWQTGQEGSRRPVMVRFDLRADGSVGFALGAYDRSLPLVIDPVLNYSTAIGGNGEDEAAAVAVDVDGHVYVAGVTGSTDLPGARIAGAGGQSDAFVARLDPTAQTILFLVVFGGSGADEVRGMTVDGGGHVWVAGTTTSSDFPLAGALPGQHALRGGRAAFVTQVSPTGNALLFSSYLGGNDADEAHGIAWAPGGGVVVVGDTRSTDFPVSQARQPVGAGLDGFVTKLASTGTLMWSTYHGGQTSDSITAVAVDPGGGIAVAGVTNSPDFPLQNAAHGHRGGYDAFVSRFSSTGTLIFSTYLGGSETDAAQGVTADSDGTVYVTGTTASGDFPASSSLGPGGGLDVFVTRFGSSGQQQASLRFGGTGQDQGRAIAVNATGVYAAGRTASADFPLLRPAQYSNAGNRDAFVVMLRDFAPVYATYFGSGGNDDTLGLAVDSFGRVLVAGALQVMAASHRGGTDAFLFRLSSGDEGADTNNNGLPDAWETQFNLDPNTTDPHADPDGDGWTNLEEYQRGTHPLGRHTRYLAEGATIAPFRTTIALFNPSDRPATVLLRFLCQRACGVPDIPGQDTVVRRLVTLAPYSRGTVNVHEVPGLEAEEFSTIIEADEPVVVDRTMTWDHTAYGAHSETAMTAASPEWYLAEGATLTNFKLYYLLQNPNDVPADVTIEYLLGGGRPPVTMSHQLPPQSRTTIDVGEAHTRLRRTEVSARISTSPETPILVERALYLRAGGRTFGAGHASAGVTTLAPTWSFAEGATGSYFDTFILLANPGTEPTTVRATFLLPDGRTVVRDYGLPAKSRENIWVDLAAPELEDTAVSTVVESLDDTPFIAERAMWWPGPTSAQWRDAHNSPGALATSSRWGLADGAEGGPTAVETYVLIANTSPFDGIARVTLSFEDGGPRLTRDYGVAANSRTNVPIGVEFPQAVGRRFAVLVDSLGALPAQLVVERAMYNNSGTQRWAAGTNALGTPLSNDKVITITAKGVTPRVLVVSQGDQVTVRNLDTAPHQMFSAPYLERSQCPAFNQIGYLAPGTSRTSGNFTAPGVCGFLDDVTPGRQFDRAFQGFVIVRAEDKTGRK